jgi:hypothetical protein
MQGRGTVAEVESLECLCGRGAGRRGEGGAPQGLSILDIIDPIGYEYRGHRHEELRPGQG